MRACGGDIQTDDDVGEVALRLWPPADVPMSAGLRAAASPMPFPGSDAEQPAQLHELEGDGGGQAEERQYHANAKQLHACDLLRLGGWLLTRSCSQAESEGVFLVLVLVLGLLLHAPGALGLTALALAELGVTLGSGGGLALVVELLHLIGVVDGEDDAVALVDVGDAAADDVGDAGVVVALLDLELDGRLVL